MKINWNRKYTTIAVYSLLVIALTALFVVFLFKFEDFTKTFSWVGGVAAPVICGIVIAYVLNPLMMYFENRLFGKIKDPKPAKNSKKAPPEFSEKSLRRRRVLARILALLLTFVVVLAVLGGILVAVVPSVAKSVVDLADQMPTYIGEMEEWVKKIFEDNPQIGEYISSEYIANGMTNFSDLINPIADSIKPMAGDIIGNVSSNVFKFIGDFLVGLKNVVIGFIIAIYLLYSKERLLAQGKKILIAFLRRDRCKALFKGLSKSNDIFKKFIISNLLDSMIIFVFMLIGTFAMGMPYQMLISVVCGLTNLVPFFGPFIGAIPCGLLILLVDPVKVIWFGLFVLVLQQIDGNVIKPFLFGETMGLPAIWVLISITVGGGLFGIPGMLLGAPVFAVFYLLFAEFVSGKLKKKNLPGETEAYVDSYSGVVDEYFSSPPPEEEAAKAATLAKTAEKTPLPNPVNTKPPQKPNPKPHKQNNIHRK